MRECHSDGLELAKTKIKEEIRKSWRGEKIANFSIQLLPAFHCKPQAIHITSEKI